MGNILIGDFTAWELNVLQSRALSSLYITVKNTLPSSKGRHKVAEIVTKKSLFHRQFSRSFRIVTNEQRHPRDVIDLAAAVQEGQLHDDEALDDVSAALLDQLDGCAESSSGR